MGVHTDDNNRTTTFQFDLSKDVYKNLKYEIDLNIKRNESLTEHTIKNKISRLLCK